MVNNDRVFDNQARAVLFRNIGVVRPVPDLAERERTMLKKLLMVGALLLMLTLGFALVPANVAHADACNGTCGADPVQAGCTSTQYIISSTAFWVNGSEWQIRLRSSTSQSSACRNKAWASLVLLQGSNNLPGSYDIEVYTYVDAYDILNASSFQSGAYTNMINLDWTDGTCAEYNGNNLNIPACT
jgi:hypothetical protein